MDSLTEAERRYLAFDLPNTLARELFGPSASSRGCACATRERRRVMRAAYRPVEMLGLALMIAFYAAAGHGVVQKIAELGTLLAS